MRSNDSFIWSACNQCTQASPWTMLIHLFPPALQCHLHWVLSNTHLRRPQSQPLQKSPHTLDGDFFPNAKVLISSVSWNTKCNQSHTLPTRYSAKHYSQDSSLTFALLFEVIMASSISFSMCKKSSPIYIPRAAQKRSEERRVGKECSW